MNESILINIENTLNSVLRVMSAGNDSGNPLTVHKSKSSSQPSLEKGYFGGAMIFRAEVLVFCSHVWLRFDDSVVNEGLVTPRFWSLNKAGFRFDLRTAKQP